MLVINACLNIVYIMYDVFEYAKTENEAPCRLYINLI